MRDGDVPAGVGEQRPGVPRLWASAGCRTDAGSSKTHRDQLEVLKLAAPTGALKGLRNAQSRSAYAVRYVDDARQFFELGEELDRDGAVIARVRAERRLCRLLESVRC